MKENSQRTREDLGSAAALYLGGGLYDDVKSVQHNKDDFCENVTSPIKQRARYEGARTFSKLLEEANITDQLISSSRRSSLLPSSSFVLRTWPASTQSDPSSSAIPLGLRLPR